MKEEIRKKIEEFLKEQGIENPRVSLDYPAHIEMGDLSTNVAMAYAKELKKKPLDLAEEIQSGISLPGVEMKAVAPGFINFFLSKEYFSDSANKKFKNTDLYK